MSKVPPLALERQDALDMIQSFWRKEYESEPKEKLVNRLLERDSYYADFLSQRVLANLLFALSGGQYTLRRTDLPSGAV
jgi:hypothetical protein